MIDLSLHRVTAVERRVQHYRDFSVTYLVITYLDHIDLHSVPRTLNITLYHHGDAEVIPFTEGPTTGERDSDGHNHS